MFDAFWLLSLGFAFFGSVSFGYLVLRFSIPDIRIISRDKKLGLSGIVGVALFAFSFGLSLVFTDFSFLFFLPLLSLIFSAFFEVRNILFGKDVMQVAVPVVRIAKQTVEYRMPAEKIGPPRVIEERGMPAKASAGPAIVEGEKVPAFHEEIKKENIQEQERQLRAEERKQRRGGAFSMQETAGYGRFGGEEPSKEELAGDRRKRYLERRGALVQEAKADLMRGKEKKEMFAKEFEAPSLNLEEITGGIDVSELEKIGSLAELGESGELTSLESLSNMNLDELGGISEIQQIPRQKGMGCPKCGNSKGTMVFCPYCGKGFCSNCSEKVEAKLDMVFLGCPHCKKEVIVKKA